MQKIQCFLFHKTVADWKGKATFQCVILLIDFLSLKTDTVLKYCIIFKENKQYVILCILHNT